MAKKEKVCKRELAFGSSVRTIHRMEEVTTNTIENNGTLYIVATPIGNLEDISARALRILGEVDIVLCEDTRMTKRLLDHYGISAKTMSYHAQSKDSREDQILEMLKKGESLALVSDAGTPTISDPGSRLVHRVKNELSDVLVSPVPGPSALMSALSASGISSAQFVFLGFFPHKKGRETLFKEIAETPRTYAFYESPHRIIKTLEKLVDYLPKTRQVAIARELTKIYEEVVVKAPKDMLAYYKENPDKVRGEFVVIVSG